MTEYEKETDEALVELDKYLDDLIEVKYKKNIRLRVIGDNSRFPEYIQEKIRITVKDQLKIT